ncbi:MAG: UvrD-helicase domain-containing protein [Rhodospirillales bacterium]|nr:UvrD-helicase domain-containing protein [Rhodospirillales bacterium]
MSGAIIDGPGFVEQRAAADPAASVWVSANAGAGKTRVLIDRVTRLLLGGTRPAAILCLTFTKAAAAEVANRLHRRLGEWSVLANEALRAELVALYGRTIADDELAPARRLFARTLDAPGRLRIQTIHAFCESLLKRFPLEAGVPPHFAVADEATAAELIVEAQERLLAHAPGDERLGPALAYVVGEVDEGGFRDVLNELVRDRRRLRRLFARCGDDAERAVAEMAMALRVRPDDTPQTLRADFAVATPAADLHRAAAALDRGSDKDGARANSIRSWLDAADRAAQFDAWCGLFLTQKGEPRAERSLITKAAQKADPGALAVLQAEQGRIMAAVARLRALTVAASTGALLRLGKALLDLYAEEKAARAQLDYDDLILIADDLLRRPGTAAWVLYKLDGGLDHILVDGTIFAVGDEKQSIFSFQGADPAEFARMRAHFAVRAEAAGQQFRPLGLERSFRSAPAVLSAVDAVFAQAAAREGLTAAETEIRHIPVRVGVAGSVELWPPVEPHEEDPGDPWDAPLDYVGAHSPPAELARRIAATVRGWLDRSEALASHNRPIRPGDVMILVRKRDAFFEEMVRALKQADVPVAGADRMVLAEQIAVMDLVALAAFALLPDDDLTLATVLKGPLFGLDDDDLFALCHGRAGRLWPALRARADEKPAWRRAADELSGLLARADFMPPFEFFAHVLATDRGRERLLARLGPEAGDPVDEFLALALAYERQHPPSLQGFLAWFESGGAEVKRDLEQGQNEVRVMTVHGAKGLEANIVFLPDTCSLPDGRNDQRLLWTGGPSPLLLWPVRKANDEELCAEARAAARAARAREYRRLLYVAATRARDRLYICGWRNASQLPEGAWYALAASALEGSAGIAPVSLPWGETGLRLAEPQTVPPERDIVMAAAASATSLPGWARRLPGPEPTPPRPLVPSTEIAPEPATRSPLAGDAGLRFRRGRLIHRLLELLPDIAPSERPAAAARFLARDGRDLDAAAQAEIARETLAVLDDPQFAALFGPGSVAEAPVVGRIGARVISGQVDRLVVTADAVLIVDYKTNRPPPSRPEDVAEAYVAQMAAYRAALARIYTGRQVRCGLLWTDGPRLMELPDRLLDRVAF